MGKIIVNTKFNKTGKRILTTPLKEEYVCAPANREYRQAYKRIEAEFKKKMHDPDNKYIETISQFIANYIARISSSYEKVNKIVGFLASCSLRTTGPRIGVYMDSKIWLQELGNIPGLLELEEKAWQICQQEFNVLSVKRETALQEANRKYNQMKRQLWREISDSIHKEFHPEDI